MLSDWPLSPEVQALKDERDRKGRLENKLINNDHENTLEKIKYLSAIGGYLGGCGAIMQMVHYERPRTETAARQMLIKAVAPPVAMAVMYGSTVKIVADVRNRDDPLNHVAAGFVAGSVWGARNRSAAKGFAVGTILAIIGTAIKMSHMYNWDWLRGLAVVHSEPYRSVCPKERLGFHHDMRSFYPGVPEQPLESEESLKNP